MASFELVAQEWKQGERRLHALEPIERMAADRVVDELVKELRRRLGGTFTVDELVAFYDQGTSWCMDLAFELAPGAPWAWDPRTTADAAFARYILFAQDYAGGRRIYSEE